MLSRPLAPSDPRARESAGSGSAQRAGALDRPLGTGAGAASFELLQAFPDDTDPDDTASVVKPIFAAVFDPLRPTRTTITYTGTDIVLSDDRWRLLDRGHDDDARRTRTVRRSFH